MSNLLRQWYLIVRRPRGIVPTPSRCTGQAMYFRVVIYCWGGDRRPRHALLPLNVLLHLLALLLHLAYLLDLLALLLLTWSSCWICLVRLHL